MEALPSMQIDIINCFTPIMLFPLLNVVIGTTDVIFGMHQNTTNNIKVRRNPSLLYRLRTLRFYRYYFTLLVFTITFGFIISLPIIIPSSLFVFSTILLHPPPSFVFGSLGVGGHNGWKLKKKKCKTEKVT
jgi:hypothetical protein